ncbi:FkbM family methyltransferase [Enterovirga sp.]|uniref:FkbM family methyltransferase n=1 Tax=Enterovirga sp. TaxID=2026350 RepID=UPI0026270420|nr:FkbM family methyltransferase [Enterovirga sp.]MDB5592146.1 methyltransferase FkbM family [Enterovirga sp.]
MPSNETFRTLHVFDPHLGLCEPLAAHLAVTSGKPFFVVYGRGAQLLLYVGLESDSLVVAIHDKTWRRLAEFPQAGATDITVELHPGSGRTLEIRTPRRPPYVLDLRAELDQAMLIQGVGEWDIAEAASRTEDPAVLGPVKELPSPRPLARLSCPDLIYDLGHHNGSDTEFYLRKGFRVVAVEANPQLAARSARRLAPWIAIGRLVMVNMGVSAAETRTTFYVNGQHPEWSSFDPKIASRGLETTGVTVNTTTMERLFQTFGVPYYLKVDIEGADGVAVEGACQFRPLPQYLSFENGTPAIFERLVSSGYSHFKMVPQRHLPSLKLPQPAREGLDVDHTFPYGSSGPFGEDTPGPWVDAAEMRAHLAEHFQRRAKVTVPDWEWWDLHARLGRSE